MSKVFFSLFKTPVLYKLFLFLMVSFTAPVGGFGQSRLYFEKEQKNGELLEITSEKTRYRNLDNPGPVYSVNGSTKIIAFNNRGNYLLLPRPDSADPVVFDVLVNDFISFSKDSPATFDRIYTLQKKMVYAKIVSEDDRELLINMNDIEVQMEKSKVACIIYKNGEHKIISDFVSVNEVLGFFQSLKINDLAKKIRPAPGNESMALRASKKNDAANQPAVAKHAGKGPTAAPIQNNTGKEQPDETEKEQAAASAERIKEADKKQQRDSLALQKKLVRDSIAAQKELLLNYKKEMSVAKSLLNKNDLVNARAAFVRAGALKPEEPEAQQQIALLDAKLQAAAMEAAVDNSYDSLMTIADSLMVSGEWKPAIENYQKASDLKPSILTPQKQIKYLKSEIAAKEEADRIKEEIIRKKELQMRYETALSKGDLAATEKRYQEALDAYNEALSIHPESEYLIARVKILSYQVEKNKNSKQ